jgi:hypothetical protein
MSKFPEIVGGSLTDLRRNQTCHKIPHKWEGRPIVFQPDYLGSLLTIFFARVRGSLPGGKEGSRIKNPLTTSSWKRYRYRKIIRAYSIRLSHAKNFPAESSAKILVSQNFPPADSVKKFSTTKVCQKFPPLRFGQKFLAIEIRRKFHRAKGLGHENID